ncbi:MAG TPA: LOG family protein [Patescibacteria group bacterium]|nr:LOG family protein [Patescibacteria group bacterium]
MMKVQSNIPSPKYSPYIKRVAIFGSADIKEDHPVYKDAFSVAQLLAKEGRLIVDGGGPGVMQAASQGARSVGGHSLAVTFYPTDMPNFEGRDKSNIVDKEIRTKNYIERMFTLMDNADAFVIFYGGTGTLSEWATAWLLAHLYYGHHKPFILFGEFWKEVISVITKNFLIEGPEMKVFRIATDIQQVLYIFDEFEQEMQTRTIV